MTLTSQVLISNNIEDTLLQIEALRRDERIVKILEGEKAFSVLDAKEAIEKAYMASEETTVLILAAKTFSPIVQNKLLKVIEEPPRNKEFILITNSKATILDTIRSRLPIRIVSQGDEETDIGLDVAALSLSSVYAFTQEHKRTDAKKMTHIVEQISKAAIRSEAFDLDSVTLALFSNAFIALDMGSPPQFVLNALLLKLLARKKR